MVRAIWPAPFWMAPLKVVEAVVARVSVTAPGTLVVTRPPAAPELAREAICWLWPSRSNVALAGNLQRGGRREGGGAG